MTLMYHARVRMTLWILALASILGALSRTFRRFAQSAAPFRGWVPVLAGGSQGATEDPTPGMTKAEIEAMIQTAAAAAFAPLVEKTLAPLLKGQTDIVTMLTRTANNGADGEALFDEKVLGKYPLGRKLKALAMARFATNSSSVKGTPDEIDAAVTLIKKEWPVSIAEPSIAWLNHAKSVMTKTTHAAGTGLVAGNIIMPAYDERWIELLTSKARIRGVAGALPMPRGATTRRRQTQDATSYYQGENEKMTPSNIRVDTISLSYKKLTTLCVVSNDLIRFAGSEADRRIEQSMIRSQALREDRAFIVGNPPLDGKGPQGIRYQTAAANVFATAGTTLTQFQGDLTSAVSRVESADIDIEADGESCYWLMSPATKWVLYALATTTGDWVFRDEILAGRLLGYKILTTTQMSVSKAWIGASAGMIMFIHAPSLEIHDSMQRSVEVFRGGSYYDPDAGAVLSGISQDETVITCIAEHDFLQVYPQACSIITGYAT